MAVAFAGGEGAGAGDMALAVEAEVAIADERIEIDITAGAIAAIERGAEGLAGERCAGAADIRRAAAMPAVPPKVTALAPVRLVPESVTVVLPRVVPEFGDAPDNVGAGVTKVNPFVSVVLPPGVVMTTSTVPEPCAGVVTVADVDVLVVTVPAVPPKVTALAPVRLVPESVTVVLPSVVPEFGDAPESVGAGVTKVKPFGSVAMPPGVPMTISTVPAACAGVVTVRDVGLSTETMVPAT